MRPTQPFFDRLPNLETEEDARAEDLIRGTSMLANLDRIPPAMRHKAKALGYKLMAAGEGGEIHPTPACSTYMRPIRGNLATDIWEISEGYEEDDQRCFTIVPPDAEVPFHELGKDTVSAMLKRLRRQLRDLGAADLRGFMMVGGHGEYEPMSTLVTPHVHGFTCGEMVELVERLKSIRTYTPTSTGAPPIRLAQIGDPAAQLTYVLQSWWPSRRIGPVGEDGEIRRSRQKRRIPEPDHTLFLLWLDRQSLRSMTFAIGGRLETNGKVVLNRDG